MRIEDRISDYIQEGLRLESISNYGDSFAQFDQADELLKKLGNKTEANLQRAMCREGKARIFNNIGRTDEAVELYKEAVALRHPIQYEDENVRNAAKVSLAISLSRTGEINEAIAIADEIQDVSGYDDVLAAVHLTSVAQLYECDLDNNYEKAKKALLKARTLLLPRVAEAPDSMANIQFFLARIAQQYEHSNKKAMFELEKGWKYIEKMGIEKFSMISAATIPLFASGLEGDMKWICRYNEVFGMGLDNGEADHIAVQKYVDGNLFILLGTAELNDSVTIERALRCVEISKDLLNEIWIAKAQCLAGCTIAELGKTKESARKSARLIKPALRVIKKMNDDFSHSVVTVGEGYIANYHFMNEEYDLALEWYQSALKGLQSCLEPTRISFSHVFSNRIKECQKHIR
ncbi:MAG: tetratricopeptide repeat protein [Clostridiales bacterium]|jgi:tetratricopeptide (TPR) repeat protein|nr:tetratricopeptide repeat protein [Clostridiales bacterium]